MFCKYCNVLTFGCAYVIITACKIASRRELGLGFNVLQLRVLTFVVDIGKACHEEQLFGYRCR